MIREMVKSKYSCILYHVREGHASLEVLQLFGKHFKGWVWNKESHSWVLQSTTVCFPTNENKTHCYFWTNLPFVLPFYLYKLLGLNNSTVKCCLIPCEVLLTVMTSFCTIMEEPQRATRGRRGHTLSRYKTTSHNATQTTPLWNSGMMLPV